MTNLRVSWKLSDYGPKNCNEDLDFFNEYKKAMMKADPTKFTEMSFRAHEVKMCLHYDEHVQNMHVSIPSNELPADSELVRN